MSVRYSITFATLLLLWQLPLDALARIKLLTLPVRERVEIRLDQAGGSLVEEERIVPLLVGRNAIDFSWNRIPLRADTLLFRIQPDADNGEQRITLLSVNYPPNENAVVWQVHAQQAGAARVRISYLLGGLDAHYSYRAKADAQEQTLTLERFLELVNRSGESFGEVTLHATDEQAITTRLEADESKRLLMATHTGVGIEKRYSVSAYDYGYIDQAQGKLKVPMSYRINNRVDSGLGLSRLPPGKVRLYQDDGKGGEAFMGEDRLIAVPPGDSAALQLGLARDIEVKRRIEENRRERVAGTLFNQKVTLLYEVENFKHTPVVVDIAESLDFLASELGLPTQRDVEWRLDDGSDVDMTQFDAEASNAATLLFRVPIPARPDEGDDTRSTIRLRLVIVNLW